MATNRKDFSSSDSNTVCRDLCSEARQRIWEKDETVEFVISGKTFKKIPPKKRSKKDKKSSDDSNSSSDKASETNVSSSNQLQQQQEKQQAQNLNQNILQQQNYYLQQQQYFTPNYQIPQQHAMCSLPPQHYNSIEPMSLNSNSQSIVQFNNNSNAQAISGENFSDCEDSAPF